MSLSWQQDDNAAADGSNIGCSDASALAIANANQEMTFGGTPGTTTPTVTIGALQTKRAGVMFESTSSDLTGFQISAGTWTVRLNVTTANGNMNWNEIYVCLFRSGSSVATIASNTAVGLSLGATGVLTASCTNGTMTAFQPGDRIYIILVFSNSAGSSQSFNFKPDQLIDTPLDKLTVVCTACPPCCCMCNPCVCTKCCSNLIPQTLHLTLTGSDNGVVPLTWDGTRWNGTFISTCGGGATIEVCLQCQSGQPGACGGFTLCFHCGAQGCPGSGGRACSSVATPCSCCVLLLSFANIAGPGDNCSGGCGSFVWGGTVSI